MRYAILAGSNYVGTRNSLNGCLNDLDDIRSLIEPSGIRIVADLRGPEMTTRNWKAALTEAVQLAQPGDLIYHMHSNHGAQIKDPSEDDGLSEIWAPDDFDWSPERMITDKWVGGLIEMLRPDVMWVDHSDNCHSGDGLRALWCPGESPRMILNERLFGLHLNRVAPMVVSGGDRRGMLLAACRSNQTAADAQIDGRACGAFTHFFLQALKEIPCGTYEEQMVRASQMLQLAGYDQRPELDCPEGAQKRSFAKDVLGL